MHMVFLICLGAYLAHETRFAHARQGDEYGIILDGGSSGTKLKVYRWRHQTGILSRDISGNSTKSNTEIKHVNGKKLDIKQVFHKKFSPGISEFAYSLNKVEKYLCNILDTATDVVPRHKKKRTPIFFYATAGMKWAHRQSVSWLVLWQVSIYFCTLKILECINAKELLWAVFRLQRFSNYRIEQ